MATSVNSKSRSRRKPAKQVPRDIQYRDKDGNEWTAKEGSPSGCFTLPGGNGSLYSIRSFLNFVQKNVATAKVVSGDDGIEAGGELSFTDAFAIVGETPPTSAKKKASKKKPPSKKSKISSGVEITTPIEANCLILKKTLGLKRNTSGVTKAMLVKQTTLSVHQISRAIASDREGFKTERRGRDTFYTLA